MGKVIINADDFGYSNAVNYGIIDAHRLGVLTSTTIMANMPGFEHAVALHEAYPDLGIGVHLTLTHGKPLLGNLETIVEQEHFKKLAFYENDFVIDQDELYQEWDAQIQKVYQSGITPTHLDSHHHSHTFGTNQEVVVELAKKYQLPVRGNFAQKDKVKHTTSFIADFDDIGEEDPAKKLGKPLSQYLSELLEYLRTHESVEIMCHPAYIDQELYDGSKFVFPRIRQVEFLIHSDFAKQLKTSADIQLVTYKEI